MINLKKFFYNFSVRQKSYSFSQPSVLTLNASESTPSSTLIFYPWVQPPQWKVCLLKTIASNIKILFTNEVRLCMQYNNRFKDSYVGIEKFALKILKDLLLKFWLRQKCCPFSQPSVLTPNTKESALFSTQNFYPCVQSPQWQVCLLKTLVSKIEILFTNEVRLLNTKQ